MTEIDLEIEYYGMRRLAFLESDYDGRLALTFKLAKNYRCSLTFADPDIYDEVIESRVGWAQTFSEDGFELWKLTGLKAYIIWCNEDESQDWYARILFENEEDRLIFQLQFC